jgi:hypothetical protein
MEMTIASKLVIETTAHLHDGSLKTHPCELYAWWGEDTCQSVDFNREIEKIKLPEGEYKITIIVESV